MKLELVVINERDNQKRLFDWLEKNKNNLEKISENSGCGCCVDIITIEGTEDIINTFPKSILE